MKFIPQKATRIPLAERIDRIKWFVAKEYGIEVEMMDCSERRPMYTTARFQAIYLARELTGETHVGLAELFGYRDHTSIFHALRRFRGWLEVYPEIEIQSREFLFRLRKELKELSKCTTN